MNSHPQSPNVPNAPRRGFSLLGLVAAVAVIGIGCALLTSAVWKAIGHTCGQIISEHSQLDTAVKAYKEMTGQYPPDLNDVDYEQRVRRFDAHLKFANRRSDMTYAKLAKCLADDDGYAYNCMSSPGKFARLDLDSLDAAEALVFWLGGFPTPYDSATGRPFGTRKLYGCNTDAKNPFLLAQPTEKRPLGVLNQYRTQPKFDFDETRLVDNDGDGWLEYVPKLDPSSNGMVPPYVYFDASNYTAWTSATPPYIGYPAISPSSPNAKNMSELQSVWGLAVPYATLVTPKDPTHAQWLNPISFQIISAGRDGQYGSQNMRVPSYPSGTTYTLPGFSNPGFYDSAEADNLTNFSPGQLQDQTGS